MIPSPRDNHQYSSPKSTHKDFSTKSLPVEPVGIDFSVRSYLVPERGFAGISEIWSWQQKINCFNLNQNWADSAKRLDLTKQGLKFVQIYRTSNT